MQNLYALIGLSTTSRRVSIKGCTHHTLVEEGCFTLVLWHIDFWRCRKGFICSPLMMSTWACVFKDLEFTLSTTLPSLPLTSPTMSPRNPVRITLSSWCTSEAQLRCSSFGTKRRHPAPNAEIQRWESNLDLIEFRLNFLVKASTHSNRTLENWCYALQSILYTFVLNILDFHFFINRFCDGKCKTF